MKILDHTYPVWDRTDGDPRHPEADASKFDGNFHPGEVSFSFSIPFPTHVDIATLSAVSIGDETPEPPTPVSPSQEESSPTNPGPATLASPKRRSRWSFLGAKEKSGESKQDKKEASGKKSGKGALDSGYGLLALPPTFREKDVPGSVRYDLALVIVQSKLAAPSRLVFTTSVNSGLLLTQTLG